jgi:hypothetical protein
VNRREVGAIVLVLALVVLLTVIYLAVGGRS